MLITREAIALKIETTQGTDAVPSPSADAILISEVNISNEGLKMIDRPLIKPSISTEKKIFAGTLKKITFKAEIKGSGAAGTAPELGQALRACGMGEIIVASTSVTYGPVSTGHEPCTIYYYQDGRLRKILGCMGTATINAEAGGLGMVDFEFTGQDGGLVDANFPVLSYDSTVPVPFIGVAFSVGTFNAVINSLSLNFTNTISTPGNVRNANGFGDVRISQRDPNGSIDPEAVLVATKDFEAIWKAGTEMALTTGVIGSVAGNRWQLDANIALRDMSQGERDQIRVETLPFGCHEQTTDDEFSISFT
ncbi:phage tail tube protein [Paraglaciecola psychrophila]|uniref:Uncharacterized protein n=1 Tax=Paraglaciecola psychrophila 170 TaxID=1129794 RepID=K7AN70_9ALTE|nr:phage tail tube protein [Paraglaciecola psychrophila]AGH44540.1 hypothetical protein C427_2431 [Paraglaciecola psychrophila 170]GAC36785.1 hypothetical protein GPSY_1148 [Paraglaciecola psychrophila 170]